METAQRAFRLAAPMAMRTIPAAKDISSILAGGKGILRNAEEQLLTRAMLKSGLTDDDIMSYFASKLHSGQPIDPLKTNVSWALKQLKGGNISGSNNALEAMLDALRNSSERIP